MAEPQHKIEIAPMTKEEKDAFEKEMEVIINKYSVVFVPMAYLSQEGTIKARLDVFKNKSIKSPFLATNDKSDSSPKT
jgi:hypothetical protein